MVLERVDSLDLRHDHVGRHLEGDVSCEENRDTGLVLEGGREEACQLEKKGRERETEEGRWRERECQAHLNDCQVQILSESCQTS